MEHYACEGSTHSHMSVLDISQYKLSVSSELVKVFSLFIGYEVFILFFFW